jgi:CheY-like chemotaxis protein
MSPQEHVLGPTSSSQNFIGHILIAEDNVANQELIKILLSKYGLTYDLANNGLEAYELFTSRHYDLILMDEQMPIMDGNEAVRKIRAYEREHTLLHTPISALTANVIKGAKERGLLSGYDAFLGKPVVLKELERVFASFLRFDSSQSKSTFLEQQQLIEGLDSKKLQEELMLSSDELVMLLGLFLKKMQTTLPELQNAIVRKDFTKIAFLAHSIKGSSANFRIESLQKNAGEMEKMAKNEEKKYEYEAVFKLIQESIEKIRIL